jgi:hypothetical protein
MNESQPAVIHRFDHCKYLLIPDVSTDLKGIIEIWIDSFLVATILMPQLSALPSVLIPCFGEESPVAWGVKNEIFAVSPNN